MKTFTITDEEEKKFEKWRKKHNKKCKKMSTEGVKISFIFTPTGLGLIKTAKCNMCDLQISLNDSDNW